MLICIVLLIWAIVSTIIAVMQHNQSQSIQTSLNAAYASLDNCSKYCGSPGTWVQAQKDMMSKILMPILQNQSGTICKNSASYPQIIQCAVDILSQQYSYWSLTDSANISTNTQIMISIMKNCSAKIPDCSQSR